MWVRKMGFPNVRKHFEWLTTVSSHAGWSGALFPGLSSMKKPNCSRRLCQEPFRVHTVKVQKSCESSVVEPPQLMS